MASQAPPLKPTHLEPSPLGTREYWDKLYTNELSNHAADPSDVGTIWFDDSSAEDKILTFLRSPRLGLDCDTTSFLDIGTGNGHFLFRLREGEEVDHGSDSGGEEGEEEEEEEEEEVAASAAGEGEETSKVEKPNQARRHAGFRGRILGTDYSPQSIEFATRLAEEKGYGPGAAPSARIEFRRFDIMASPSSEVLSAPQDGYDVVLDKGTFDAVSLSGETDSRGRKICEGYMEKVTPLVRPGGLFLVTSCNWTEEELKGWFEGEGELAFVHAIRYRSFSFGGGKGQTISSVCFKRKRKGAS